MRRILDFLRSVVSSEDLMDTEVYVQIMGRRIAETNVPKAKAKCTIVNEEHGNKLTVNVTEIGRLDCGHWNIELAAQCSVCSATFCKYCISEGVGHNCSGCGRFVCPACARHSLIDPEIVLCGQCGSMGSLPAIVRKLLCGS